MLMVRASVVSHFNNNHLKLVQPVCERVIPSIIIDRLGLFDLGSTQFEFKTAKGLSAHCLLEVGVYNFTGSTAAFQKVAEEIESAFNVIFPGYTFGVSVHVVRGGWSSGNDKKKACVALSTERAIERFRVLAVECIPKVEPKEVHPKV